jgi:hypothetical protein
MIVKLFTSVVLMILTTIMPILLTADHVAQIVFKGSLYLSLPECPSSFELQINMLLNL